MYGDDFEDEKFQRALDEDDEAIERELARRKAHGGKG